MRPTDGPARLRHTAPKEEEIGKREEEEVEEKKKKKKKSEGEKEAADYITSAPASRMRAIQSEGDGAKLNTG